MFKQISNELLNFIKNSPSCYHAIDNMKHIFLVEDDKEIAKNLSLGDRRTG